MCIVGSVRPLGLNMHLAREGGHHDPPSPDWPAAARLRFPVLARGSRGVFTPVTSRLISTTPGWRRAILMCRFELLSVVIAFVHRRSPHHRQPAADGPLPRPCFTKSSSLSRDTPRRSSIPIKDTHT